jgi:membrane protein DedA with SNARE-associated domain/4-amino-4-deoxy-L-arabinose transferase-like glycosyltransferase
MSAATRWGRARASLGGLTLVLLGLLIAQRLALLAVFPLGQSEGRYAEIARKMVEFGDWVTPWFAVGVPFWGKPPLATWLSAAFIEVFGATPLAARIPHLLVAIAILWLTVGWGRRAGLRQPLYIVPLLASSFLFLVASGAVMTDMALCLGAILSTRGFWLAVNGPSNGRRTESWLFFLGLAIMLLAKGPVGWVLILLPIAAWTLWTRSARQGWNSLPWIRGLLFALVLAAPWYALAEIRTPGFLEYFFVGEHWNRFVVPGWKGDLYGSAHAFPRGSIWLFALAALLPWSVVLPIAAWRARRRGRHGSATTTESPSVALYCLLCGLAPCVVFTLAGNILWTYVLPGLPPLALWAATWLERREILARRLLLVGTAGANLTLAAALGIAAFTGLADRGSAAGIVALYQSQRHPEVPLVFWGSAPQSAAFYTSGRALEARSTDQLAAIASNEAAFVVIRKADRETAATAPLKQLQMVGEAGEYRLLLRPPTSGTAPIAVSSSDGQAVPERKSAPVVSDLVDLVLHVDIHLAEFVAQHGAWVYALVFAVIFVETGLVVMPFLPGDSLLFIVGSLCAVGAMQLPSALAFLLLAAVLGDQLNFVVGRKVGQRAFAWEQSLIFNRRAFDRTHAFYEKYGGITIVVGRFLPFVRTFAPFVAGIAGMNRTRFTRYNIVGAALWTVGLTLAGYLLGNVPLIQRNMSVVLWALVLVPGAVAIVSSLRIRLQSP